MVPAAESQGAIPACQAVSVIQITLPLPPSANRMWRMMRGQMRKSPEYRAWMADAAVLVAVQAGGDQAQWFGCSIVLPATRRDPDNSVKAICDALQAGGAVQNDRMLRRLELSVDDTRAEADGALIRVWATDAPAPKPRKRNPRNG